MVLGILMKPRVTTDGILTIGTTNKNTTQLLKDHHMMLYPFATQYARTFICRD